MCFTILSKQEKPVRQAVNNNNNNNKNTCRIQTSPVWFQSDFHIKTRDLVILPLNKMADGDLLFMEKVSSGALGELDLAEICSI